MSVKKTDLSKREKGFSLVETILALALFCLAAVLVSQVCYNCVYPFSIKDEDPTKEEAIDMCMAAIQGVADYDALEDGIDVTDLNGVKYRVYGYATPTQIPDLFELEMLATYNGGELKAKTLVLRKNWYEDTNLRERLIEDRTDFLEDKREVEANQ